MIKKLFCGLLFVFGILGYAETGDNGLKSSTMDVEVSVVTEYTATLGEGALWDYKEDRLLWIDIQGKKLMVYYPEENLNEIHDLPSSPGTVVPVKNDIVLLALSDGIYTYNLKTRELAKVADPEPKETKVTSRFNDGKCDPAGRFWVGSMHNGNRKPQGAALYRIGPNYDVSKELENISISNGIAWSLDKTRMYYIDTPTKHVASFDYDNKNGQIANKEITVEVPDGIGFPDGSTIDSEGMLWIAMWDGHSITRWNPETGELLQRVELPALNVTSLAFGGEKLDEIYITTAKTGVNEKSLQTYPLSGKLLKIKLGVKGVKANYYKP